MSLNKSILFSCKSRISILKTVLIGETAVGKSSIINRFTKNTFEESFMPTLTGVCVSKEIIYEKINKTIRFEIWDTAGQEIYRSLTKLYYKDASIVIFVYDITRKDTFEEIRDYWCNEVINNCPKDAIFAVVGNKNDLYELEEVNIDYVIEFCQQINAFHNKTSAKTGSGIEEMFFNIGLKFLGLENNNILSKSYQHVLINKFNTNEQINEKDSERDETTSKLSYNNIADNKSCCS